MENQKCPQPPKAILICGKLCCGKSYYTRRLRHERQAAVLSCDELTLALFPHQLGDRHEEVAQSVQAFLLQKAVELLETNIPVILEWGFWTEKSRRETEEFFRERGLETEWHYLSVSEETWRRNMEKRSREAPADAYQIDGPLAEKCARLFQPPKREEIDVWIENEWR